MKFVVLALYALMMASIIFISARKSLNLNDFFLGGRKVGPWFSAFAYGTTYFSAVIIIGYAGKIGWEHGLSAVWIGLGNAFIGNLLAWVFLARRTRMMGERLNVCTMPDFFEKRYGDRRLRMVAALLIFVFLVPYSASVYQGLGSLIQIALGIDFFWCVLICAVLASLYLFVGGYRATSISDFIQGIVMLVGIVLMTIFVVRGAGGVPGAFSKMEEAGGPGFASLFGQEGKRVDLLSLVLLTSMGTWGLPQMMHKFFAIKDAGSVKKATVISTAFCIFLAGSAYFMGSFGKQILGGVIPEGGLNLVMPLVFTSPVVGMPDWLLGLVVVLVLSASMSTLTSLVLASASAVAMDLFPLIMPKMKQETTTLIMRVLCLAFVALSLIITFGMQGTPIVTLMAFSWGSLSGAFLAPFLYGLFWKGVTRAGVWAGMLGGLAVSLILPAFGLSTVVGGVVAMAASLILVPAVSILTPKTRLEASVAERAFVQPNA